ncbi:hypothetical protein SAMN04488008_102510 [Maribacter orientalis]|uniref:Uncharacterized protein n=1 Tax=Maribacter orientalis TaxID=228957 RepID=A0A1H7L932_9FLAO|nr:hypothetical protein [Maribacter orientalis]SEK95479.1 hypothetical protein SAMN04488008_102510 [Maribacter orientalis]
MKKSFLKFLLSICILLSSVYSPLFANINSGENSLYTIEQQFAISTHSNLLNSVRNQNATIKGSFDNADKVLEIDATEIEEEEENEHSFIKKGGEFYYTSTTFYLLSLLFLFSFFTNNNRFQRLFTHFSYINRRFVLFQVFRL